MFRLRLSDGIRATCNRPVTKAEWRRIQGDPTGAYEEYSDSSAHFQNQKFHIREEDATGNKTTEKLEEHRMSRDTALGR